MFPCVNPFGCSLLAVSCRDSHIGRSKPENSGMIIIHIVVSNSVDKGCTNYVYDKLKRKSVFTNHSKTDFF